MKALILFLLAIPLSQLAHAQSDVEPHAYNYGGVPLANQFYAAFIVRNNGMKSEYLLKVDADNSIVYKKPVNAIEPGGSDTLRVWYNPEKEGDFDKELKIYLSNSPEPTLVSLKGKLLKLDKDPTINCYSFSQKDAGINILLCDIKMKAEDATNGNPIEGASVTQYFNSKPSFTMKSDADGMLSLSVKPNLYHYWIEAKGYESIFVDKYINRQTGIIVFKLTPLNKEATVVTKPSENKVKTFVKNEDTGELPTSEFSPNNIVFLIDVSASMKFKERIPLLKEAMHHLIDQLRSVDKVSIITYADDARVIYPSMSVTDKEGLRRKIDSLVANGGTSVTRGISLAHKVVTDNFIDGGNNQIVLATDGAFHVNDKDMELFEKSDGGKKKRIMVTILGFGHEKGLSELKKLASRLDGHYIYVEDAGMAQDVLLKEIKKNSRRKR